MESYSAASYRLGGSGTSPDPIRIMLVDDHELIVIGLRTILGSVAQFEVVGEAESAAAALPEARRCQPDVVVMDVQLPDGSGVDACRHLCAELPQVRVVMLSAFDDEDAVVGAVMAGAAGYVLKQSGHQRLIEAIHVVAGGGSLLDSAAAHVALEWARDRASVRPAGAAWDLDEEREAPPHEQESVHPAPHAGRGRRHQDSPPDGQLAPPRANLRPPVVPHDLIPRPALVSQLEHALTGPLTVLSAPAGFGKTTLISAWAARCPQPVAWLSLDRNEGLKGFLRSLVAAIESVSPGLCAGTLGMLQLPKLPAPAHLASRLAEDLADIPDRLTIVLDDYQLVTAIDVHLLLASLIRWLPASVHVVIATRTELPGTFTPLRARGTLTEIGKTSLRFSLDEAKDFLGEVLGLPEDQELVERLADRTEGWPAVLRLARLVLSEQADQRAWVSAFLRGSHPYVREFLIDHVLATQSPQVQDILLCTSILDRFCAAELDVLLGNPASEPHGEEILQMLLRSNLFVTQLDPEGKWCRYHQLFQEALQDKLLAERGAAQVAELHDRAIQWLEDQGLVDEAVRHALQARRIEKAAALVEEQRHTALGNGEWFSLEVWLDLLPRGLREQRPKLLLAYAWTLHYRHREADVAPALHIFERLLERCEGDIASITVLRAEASAISSMARLIVSPPERALEEAQHALVEAQYALGHLPPDWSFARGFAAAASGSALSRLGRSDEAVEQLLAAGNDADGTSDAWRSQMLASLTRLHWAALDLPAAEETAELLAAIGERRRFAKPEALGHYYLGLVYHERNELERAAEQFKAAMALRQPGNAAVWTNSALGTALVCQARGEEDAATAQMQEIEDFVWQTQNTLQVALVHSLKVRLVLLRGDLDAASRLLHGARVDLSLTTSLETVAFTWSLWQLMLGTDESLGRANRIASDLERRGESLQHRRIALQAAIVRALVHDHEGRTAEALASLEHALSLAEPGGVIRTFVDVGAPMQHLLTLLSTHGSSHQPYLERVLASFHGHETSTAAALRPHRGERGVSDELTWRELQVLELLSERLSNKEIADRLVVSPLTVKRHTVAVYRKLQVTGRRQAVTRAFDLQLLPMRQARETPA